MLDWKVSTIFRVGADDLSEPKERTRPRGSVGDGAGIALELW